MACGEIAVGHTVDCTTIPPAGTMPEAYVYNHKDLAAPTVGSGIITAINLVGSALGYKFIGLESAYKKSEDFVRNSNTGLGAFKHFASLTIYARTQAIKDGLIKQFANGRFVFVMRNRGTDNDAFEMLGRDCGLRLVPSKIRDQFANDGLFVLNFATPDGEIENESDPAQTVYVTSQADTITMLEATLA
jgi:hypothetical protein